MKLSDQGLPPGYNFILPAVDEGAVRADLSGTVSLVGGELLWNVTVGCSGGSPACADCVAKPYWERWSRSNGYYVDADSWGNVIAYDYAVRVEPARWPQQPQRILVAPAGDLFNDKVPDAFIDRVLLVMQQHPQHTFYLLTKRAQRMKAYLAARARGVIAAENRSDTALRGLKWPLSNVCIGISCENQLTYMSRVRHLVETPALRRFVVVEPMLGPVRLDQVPLETRDILWPLKGIVQAYRGQDAQGRLHWEPLDQPLLEVPAIDWVVVGGYRGAAVRPMHPHWVRTILRSCQRENVPFFFKGWGDYAPTAVLDLSGDETLVIVSHDGTLRGRGVGSSTNFLAVQTEPVPDVHMTRRSDGQMRDLLDGRRYRQMIRDVAGKRVRLVDCSDLARMLHRLSNPQATVSGPVTATPAVANDSAMDASASAERQRPIADWLRHTIGKPLR
ncbi:protein gp37 [Fontimonas thermophila]|uniref:Protein gp37 n=1 Tax=Fontimonas thermophila TaxID=1076937 RepID=A0A1I2I462_9GAMM|nr:DUF5131 family protein [Fontimonas thermophila]SFF37135.1 protein gp37 [Fontimonas thermophila]